MIHHYKKKKNILKKHAHLWLFLFPMHTENYTKQKYLLQYSKQEKKKGNIFFQNSMLGMLLFLNQLNMY